jgi:hypothetical protein
MKMNDVCLKAFNELCEELSTSKLASLEESQYWIFERGYKAALEELVNNMTTAAKSQERAQLNKLYLARKAA